MRRRRELEQQLRAERHHRKALELLAIRTQCALVLGLATKPEVLAGVLATIDELDAAIDILDPDRNLDRPDLVRLPV